MFILNWQVQPGCRCGPATAADSYARLLCRFYSILNSLGLYNKNAKILFLVLPPFWPACVSGPLLYNG